MSFQQYRPVPFWHGKEKQDTTTWVISNDHTDDGIGMIVGVITIPKPPYFPCSWAGHCVIIVAPLIQSNGTNQVIKGN